MNPGDTVTLYGEEVEIVDKWVHAHWTRYAVKRGVEVFIARPEELRRLPHPDKAARWHDCPWRPFVGSV